MIATGIRWEVDYNKDLNDLPSEISIPFTKDFVDLDEVSDYLSDQTGFLHDGYSLKREIVLSKAEKKELKNYLFDRLNTLCEYHGEIVPERNDDVEVLLEKYCYWIENGNENYSLDMDLSDRRSKYIMERFFEYHNDCILEDRGIVAEKEI